MMPVFGMHTARFYVTDPDGLRDTVIVHFEISMNTPTLMSLFTADAKTEGIELRWQFGAAGLRFVGLERGDARTGPWMLARAELSRDGDVVVALDRSVIAGRTDHYRLLAQSRDGQTLTFGPLSGPPRSR